MFFFMSKNLIGEQIQAKAQAIMAAMPTHNKQTTVNLSQAGAFFSMAASFGYKYCGFPKILFPVGRLPIKFEVPATVAEFFSRDV